MTRPMFTSLCLAAMVQAVGCGHKASPAPAASASAVAVKASAKPVVSASAKPVPLAAGFEVSEEMRDFVAKVAEDQKLSAALAKFAAPSLDEHGVGIDPIESPKVVGTDPSAGDCYILQGADGPAVHEYLICWDNKQVIQVADRGMK